MAGRERTRVLGGDWHRPVWYFVVFVWVCMDSWLLVADS